MCGQVVCGISATLATQSDDRCHLVPRMPRKVKVDVTQCHACHAKRMWMSPSATPATPTAAAPRRSTPAQARHRSQPSAIRATPATQKWKSMSPSTTPATVNEDGCLQVPCLPRQQPRRPGATPKTKRAARASPVP